MYVFIYSIYFTCQIANRPQGFVNDLEFKSFQRLKLIKELIAGFSNDDFSDLTVGITRGHKPSIECLVNNDVLD